MKRLRTVALLIVILIAALGAAIVYTSEYRQGYIEGAATVSRIQTSVYATAHQQQTLTAPSP